MGFWEKAFGVAKDVGTSVAGHVNEKANEIRQLKEQYESMSDDELIQIANSDGFFSKTQMEKGTAFAALRARGYTADDVRLKKNQS